MRSILPPIISRDDRRAAVSWLRTFSDDPRGSLDTLREHRDKPGLILGLTGLALDGTVGLPVPVQLLARAACNGTVSQLAAALRVYGVELDAATRGGAR